MRYYKLLLSTALFFALMLCNTFEAQAQGRKKMPHWEARAGIGLLPTFLKDHAKTELQPVSLELRYRPTQKFSIGLLAGMSISQAMQEHHTGEIRTVRNNFQMFAVPDISTCFYDIQGIKRTDGAFGLTLAVTKG